MGMKILGEESAYLEAIGKRGENMVVAANLVIEMSERIGELENAAIDLKAGLRACQNTSNSLMEQYKNL